MSFESKYFAMFDYKKKRLSEAKVGTISVIPRDDGHLELHIKVLLHTPFNIGSCIDLIRNIFALSSTRCFTEDLTDIF